MAKLNLFWAKVLFRCSNSCSLVWTLDHPKKHITIKLVCYVTTNIKRKPQNPAVSKTEGSLLQNCYARVTKALNIIGPIKDWDSQTQQFKSKGVEASEKNQKLIEFKTKYLKVAED